MYKISIERLKKGMIVGKNIHDAKGNFLLKKGTCLTSGYIQRLKSLRVSGVYIISSNSYLNINEPEDIIQEKTRVHALRNVFSAFNNYQLTGSLEITELIDTASSIVQDLLANKNAIVQTSEIRLYDDYTFSHSVHVAVLATMLGRLCNYSKNFLNKLTLGALLHDIGKTKTPIKILNKPDRLTILEEEIIQRHPEDGFEILRKAKLFSSVPAYIAYQHHEKYDGSGYPCNLVGDQIHEYARIVAIVDVFDALTADRSYKKAYKPDVAYKIMVDCSKGHFDPILLEKFFDHIAIYPVGTILRLTSGYYAVVLEVAPGYTRTPLLRLFADFNKHPITPPYFIDLKKIKENMIESVVDEYQLIEILETIKFDP